MRMSIKEEDSNEHIRVYVRCRPLMKSEVNFPVPVEVHPQVNKILIRDTGTDKSTVKSFSFDRVFGSESKQEVIYNEVVAPVIQEVIFGFNCTILAYGQTGTGKTFTIEGGRSSKDKSNDSQAGIIPRAMKHLFNDLIGQDMKFEICVSFLELYNEEIFDLLSNVDGVTKLRIFDNSTQKGSVIVQGLQVVNVKNMQDVYAILDKGCKKRKKADTLLNKASSRSHTVFTVTVKVKETSSTLEKVKCGKLNLVDLAGSENIGRSGAIDKRAREAGNINQSLLALGRVITSLCEKATHIPYRESKLTRLLQDSLGGQTKTAVIATISPSAAHIDETLNTLDYALRVKSITNKPELNTQFTVNSLTQDYLEEINRLKKSICDVGSKKGFCVPEEHIKHWESTLESKKEKKFELLLKKVSLEEENKLLDNAIAEASNEANEEKKLLENAKLQQEKYIQEMEKLKQDRKLHEAMLQVMEPLFHCFHEKCHKDFAEKQAITAELTKAKEKLNSALAEKRNCVKMLQEIKEKRKKKTENLRLYSENIKNNIRNANENMNRLSSECNNYATLLKNGFETRANDCKNQFLNLTQAVNDIESMNNNFEINVEAALQEDKSSLLKGLDDFQDAYLASNDNSVLQPLNLALSKCETSLLSISASLNEWKQDLLTESSTGHKHLKEYLDNQGSALKSATISVNQFLNEQKQNIETCNARITESLNAEVANKQMWNDQFINVEQALSSLDTFCTQYVRSGVDATTEVHSLHKKSSETGSEFATKLTGVIKNIEKLQNEGDCQLQNTFSDKMEEMNSKVSTSCSRYKDLNSELAKCCGVSQNIHGPSSDIGDLLKNKYEAHKVAGCIQETTETLVKCGDNSKSFLTENKIRIDELFSKDKTHLDKLTDSSKELSDSLNTALSKCKESLETDLINSLVLDDYEVNNTKAEGTFENSQFELDETITLSSCSEDTSNQNECPVCSKRNADETLQDDGHQHLPSVSPKTENTFLKANEVASSRSLMSPYKRSPLKRPRNKNTITARKNLQFYNIDKLADEILETSSSEAES